MTGAASKALGLNKQHTGDQVKRTTSKGEDSASDRGTNRQGYSHAHTCNQVRRTANKGAGFDKL